MDMFMDIHGDLNEHYRCTIIDIMI
jgi:hypothetical protein